MQGYAVRARVNPGTLSWWKSKLGEAVSPAPFVEVTSQVAAIAGPERGMVELVVGRVVVRLVGQVDVDALVRVLDVLEARA